MDNGEEEAEIATGGRSRLFVRGFVVQVLNPKIAIFFLA